MAPLKLLARLACLAFLAFLALGGTGCAPTSRPVLLDVPSGADRGGANQDGKWEKYGAYYLVDETFVETSFESAFLKSPVNKYIINKKIRILTLEGVKFGTVEVPVHAFSTGVFRLEHWDSAGVPVKVAADPIRSEYLKSGKIIFPNVAPGSLLGIYIEFNTTSAITTLEHWFSGPIPVAEGRFTFSYLDMYGYDFKSYGPVREGETGREKGSASLAYKTWVIKNAYPRTSVDYQDDIDVTEPRVALVIRRFNVQQVFESWEEISDDYEKYALKTSFFQSTKKLFKLVDSLGRDLGTDLEKAQAAFAWVQKNVSYKSSSLGAINPDRVVASGQGNLWEMAVVLREAFGHLGLQTDVLITRPRSMGGFDPAFVSPAQLGVPLVTVKIAKKTYLAFPWSRGAALGEFPLDYFGLQSLSLLDRSAASLPDFAAEQSYTRNTLRLHPEDETAPIDMEMETGGYLGFAVRNSLMDEQKKDIQEAYQKVLTALGTSNGLLKCDVQGLDKPGKPVVARLSFSNPNQTVARKGEIQMRLSHVFHAFFSNYDTTRSSGFKTNLDLEHSETLRVPKVAGKVLAPSIQCRDIANSLFRLACAVEDLPGEFVFKRTVNVYRKKLTASEMRSLASDIGELNRIKESSLVWKSEGGEAPAATVKKKGRR